MATKAIRKFLKDHYTDERLAALLAHAQDGKLVYDSCCCLIGTATSGHALQGTDCPPLYGRFVIFGCDAGEVTIGHYAKAKALTGAEDAEDEYHDLGRNCNHAWDKFGCDPCRRRIIKRVIKDEIRRRERISHHVSIESKQTVSA